MLKLIMAGNEVFVHGRSMREEVIIDQVTRFRDPKAIWSKNYGDGKKDEDEKKWDGYRRLFKVWEGTFPRGMLFDVEMQLLINDIPYEIVDKRVQRVFNKVRLRYSGDPPLYYFQREALDAILRNKIGIISLPTGTGKTRLAQALIGEVRLPTIFFVTRERLLAQTMKSFETMFGCKIGQVGRGKMELRPITVATVQTAHKMDMDLFSHFGIWCFDECLPGDVRIQVNGREVPISEVAKMDGVVSSYRDGRHVEHEFIHKTTRVKDVYQYITECGEVLTCTKDHNVLTPEGMRPAAQAKQLVRSLLLVHSSKSDEIKARLFGAMLGDGWISVPSTRKYGQAGMSGRLSDMEEFNQDLLRLGLPVSSHRNSRKTVGLASGRVIRGTTENIILRDVVTRMLLDLEYPVGRKTDIDYSLPDWLMSGSIGVKREFIAGFLGAEGSTPDPRLKRSFYVARVAQFKIEELVDSGVRLMGQVRQLFSDLDVETTGPHIKKGNVRKSGKKTFRIDLTICNTSMNLFNYSEIGFRYNKRKEIQNAVIGTYIQYALRKTSQYQVLKKKAMQLIEDGIPSREIWGNLGVSKAVFDGWVRKRRRGTRFMYPSSVVMTFDKWKQKVDGEFITLDVEESRFRSQEQCYNLEVLSKEHNYIADNFVVSNCHHMAADTVFNIAKHSTGEYLIGLSATPTREDGKEMLLQAGIGRVIYYKSTSQLINETFLAIPEIAAIEVDPIHFDDRHKYEHVVREAIVHNRQRNLAIALGAVEDSLTGKVYIHVNRLDHGPILTKMINNEILSGEKDRRAVWLCGKDTVKKKDDVLHDFEAGNLKILVSTLLGEGVDIPSMYSLFMAAGGGKGAKVTTPQILGRVLRRSKHRVVKFTDIADRCKYLGDHFKERCKYYNSEPAFAVDPLIQSMGMG